MVRPPELVEPPVTISEVRHGHFRSAAISPDSRSPSWSSATGVFIVRELDSLFETELPGVEDAYTPFGFFFSADGERIGYTDATALYTVPVAGGSPIKGL